MTQGLGIYIVFRNRTRYIVWTRETPLTLSRTLSSCLLTVCLSLFLKNAMTLINWNVFSTSTSSWNDHTIFWPANMKTKRNDVDQYSFWLREFSLSGRLISRALSQYIWSFWKASTVFSSEEHHGDYQIFRLFLWVIFPFLCFV